ncbi:hypothetical protein GCK32_011736 [Trichostrongylus colubriformis]|uniref:Uncharacterized protein n=1 Tax=Trichostrongylus colubriformis TaxID=6319 RepID=A0AAN8IYT9_TRICO
MIFHDSNSIVGIPKQSPVCLIRMATMSMLTRNDYSIRIEQNEQESEQEVTNSQSGDNLKRARAGGDGGCDCNEIFLIVIAVIFAINVLLDILAYRNILLLRIIVLSILVIVIIAGIVTKSSICMLIAMIMFAIALVFALIFLVLAIIYLLDSSIPFDKRIVELVKVILLTLFLLCACLASNTLRQRY